jgi:hypothetical protein
MTGNGYLVLIVECITAFVGGVTFLVGLPVAALYVIDQAARDLAADVRLAMKRADLSLDYVSRVIRVPPNKLSDQLSGKAPFTVWCRFVTLELQQTEFWPEFLALRAERTNQWLVKLDLLAMLVVKVTELVNHKPVMVKATIDEGPHARQRERA